MDKPINAEFYLQEDVVKIAFDLIGKIIFTTFDEGLTAGMITETEAYAGISDRASHAFGGKITPRNRVMYESGGVSYVYLCYGIHHLFNIVTNTAGVPHAVLLRGIKPLEGITIMEKRRKRAFLLGNKFSGGPGTAAEALGIKTMHNGESLINGRIWIEDHGQKFEPHEIIAGPRVGVDYAGEDALLPYRFRLRVE